MSATHEHEALMRIAHDHPALPGHFPGRPVVPGVVVLDSVLGEAERWLGRSLALAALPQAKFTSALLPDETARIELELLGSELRFSVAQDERPIARGIFTLAAEPVP